VSILRHGDFFGEGSLLEERNHRFTSARCATPVDLIKVSREDFNAYIASSKDTKQSLKQKYKARCLLQAKQLIRLQAGLAKRNFKMNENVYKEGDMGESMFLADDKSGGKLEVKQNGKLIHTLNAGDTFGESSLLFRRPRKSTVTCVAERCNLYKLHSDAFYEMLEIDPTTKSLLYRMARQRTWE
jgi:CRP-like cAMP-binding protein